MNTKIEKFDLQYYKDYLNAYTYNHNPPKTEIANIIFTLIAEIERLQKENEGLKRELEYIKCHTGYYEAIQEIKSQQQKIINLQRVVECAKELDFKELQNIITDDEEEYDRDHTEEKEQLNKLQQFIAEQEEKC